MRHGLTGVFRGALIFSVPSTAQLDIRTSAAYPINDANGGGAAYFHYNELSNRQQLLLWLSGAKCYTNVTLWPTKDVGRDAGHPLLVTEQVTTELGDLDENGEPIKLEEPDSAAIVNQHETLKKLADVVLLQSRIIEKMSNGEDVSELTGSLNKMISEPSHFEGGIE